MEVYNSFVELSTPMRKFAPYMLALLGVKIRKDLGANLRKAVLRFPCHSHHKESGPKSQCPGAFGSCELPNCFPNSINSSLVI